MTLTLSEDDMILASYGDDSTDKKRDGSTQPRILCVGSFLGWPESFFEIARRWNKKLDDHKVAYFRASECEGLEDEFAPEKRGFSLNSARAFADSTRRDLVEILANQRAIGGICIALILEDFQEVLRSDPRAPGYFGDDPAIYVYATLIKKSIDLLDTDWPESKGVAIAFEFDTHSKMVEAEAAYRKLETVPRFAARLGHIGHSDDKKVAEIQMADLMAHEGRHKAHLHLQSSEQDRSSFRVLAETNSVYYCGLIDRVAMIAEMDEHDTLSK